MELDRPFVRSGILQHLVAFGKELVNIFERRAVRRVYGIERVSIQAKQAVQEYLGSSLGDRSWNPVSSSDPVNELKRRG